MSLYMKRLEHGRFIWPAPKDGAVAISAAQMGHLLRSSMSVPLLGRLMRPQIDAFDGARAEAAERGNDLGGVFEEVGPAGLAVD